MKQLRINKIYLKGFIETLMNIYDKGADFIDIVGTPKNSQDIIQIEVRYEYLTNEDDKGLTEDDINNLLEQ